MEYLAGKISHRLLRGGFELSMTHRFLITTVYPLIFLLIFPHIKILRSVQGRLFDAPWTGPGNCSVLLFLFTGMAAFA